MVRCIYMVAAKAILLHTVDEICTKYLVDGTVVAHYHCMLLYTCFEMPQGTYLYVQAIAVVVSVIIIYDTSGMWYGCINILVHE